MLMHRHKSVCLSLVSTDLPVWSVVQSTATLYQKDQSRFHILFTEPKLPAWTSKAETDMVDPSIDQQQATQTTETPRLLWLEISPHRVIMTMQGDGKFSYRHFWEKGVYGMSRFWLQNAPSGNQVGQLKLRNFTKSLTLRVHDCPRRLLLEYELWSERVQLGQYVLDLVIEG